MVELSQHADCGGIDIIAFREGMDQITGVKFAIAVPITFLKRGVVGDTVLVFSNLEDQYEVAGIKDSIPIRVARDIDLGIFTAR